MSKWRTVVLIILFFVGLYILRDSVLNTGPNINRLLVLPFQEFINQLKTATTTLQNQSPLSTTGESMIASSSLSTDALVESNKKQYTPAPLIKVSTGNSTGEKLTATGIITYTNDERHKEGLPALTVSSKLSASALEKLDDLFNKQYFEHISPTGESVSNLAERDGYQYIIIGENLALGNFGSDEKVVAAWMASPGHRDNILNHKYQQIGVAVAEREYQGKLEWIAVQHFGEPLSACPVPNVADKKYIDTTEKQLAINEQLLTSMKADIDTSSDQEKQAKIDAYNTMIVSYNTLLDTLKIKIGQYNDSVKKFNSCVGA